MKADGSLHGGQSPARFGYFRENHHLDMMRTRRQFLCAAALSATSLLGGFSDSFALASPEANGRVLDLIPFDDERIAPVETLIGAELDGRLYTDTARISANRLVTPTAAFFVRTAASKVLPPANRWKVRVEGSSVTDLSMPSLRAASRPMGTHLIECAGNVRLTRFGLISVAEWAGIPITEVLERGRVSSKSAWIEVSGFDQYAGSSATSIPGASWIFRVDQLESAGAFLAIEMNGRPLTPHHGAPVRLVVPGWYGCSCIKWVDNIRVAEEGAAATSQMREYAVRTLQSGTPQLARDFEPAIVEHAAVPVRIEKSRKNDGVQYRVVGIAWGGSEPIRKLAIRFNPEEEFVAVEGFNQVKTDAWTVWSHVWAPRTPGAYKIRLAVADPQVRARKMQLGLYDRTVEIREV